MIEAAKKQGLSIPKEFEDDPKKISFFTKDQAQGAFRYTAEGKIKFIIEQKTDEGEQK